KQIMSCSSSIQLQSYLQSLTSSVSALAPQCRYYSNSDFLNELNLNNSVESLRIFHINIRSLNANHSKLYQLMSILNFSFDIIILTEIWSFNIYFFANLFPYYSFHYVLPVNSSIGGVGAFIHNSYSMTVVSDLGFDLTLSLPVETLFFTVSKNNFHCLIGGLYRHPTNNISNFSNNLEIL